MGKYTRKAKISGDVAVMEVSSQSNLGVRTRAKTLALQRSQSSSAEAAVASSGSSSDDSCYLELRSRRLEKPSLFKKQQNSQRACKEEPETKIKNSCGRSDSGSDSSLGTGSVKSGSNRSGSICGATKDEECFKARNGEFEKMDLGTEGSFGENNMELEARDRTTRESTPCSLIRVQDTIGTPGSSSRQASPSAASRRALDAFLRNMPSAAEIEDFFTRAEQAQQQLFIEKYNFDIVNDVPLQGRYEWVQVNP